MMASSDWTNSSKDTLYMSNDDCSRHPELTDTVTLNSFQGLKGIPDQVRDDKEAVQHDNEQSTRDDKVCNNIVIINR